MPVFKDPERGGYWEFDPDRPDIPEEVRNEYLNVSPEFISVPGQPWSEVTQEQWERMPNVRNFAEQEKERKTLQAPEQPVTMPQVTTPQENLGEQAAKQQVEEFKAVQTTNDMPDNWDRLSESEKWLYTKGLPWVASSGVGKALESFGKTAGGKLLNNVFDVLAEGTERTQGLVTQASLAAKEGKPLDIPSAWKAGSLFYDVLADEDINDLADMFDVKSYRALAEAQVKIADGMSVEQAKEEYYNDQGALALRSQLVDTLGHVVLDPLNLIAGEAKIPSRVSAARAAIIRTGSKAAQIAEQELNAAQDALKVANVAGDATQIEQAATRVVNATLAHSTALGEFNWAERSVLNLTGGLPSSAEDLGKWAATGNLSLAEAAKMGVKGVVKDWRAMPWNWFKLTPEAKMQETLGNISVQSQALIANADNADDIVETLRRAAAGVTGPELGHVIASPAGRVAQSSIVAAQQRIDDLGMAYKALEEPRMRLRDLAELSGKDVKEVAGILSASKDGAAAMKELAKAEGLRPLIDAGQLTADTLDTLKQFFKDAPFDLDTFKAHAVGAILDETARIGIEGLGLKPKGFWQRLSAAVKDVETLAFLRVANPAYPVQNKLNNLVTMGSRGVFGLVKPEDAVAFFEKNKIPLPPSMLEGFGGPAEIGGKAGLTTNIMMRGAEQRIGQATRSKGKLQEFQDFIKSIGKTETGKGKWWDTGEYARVMESNDSARATFAGYNKYYKPAWRKAVNEIDMDDILGADVAKKYKQALASGFSPDDIDRVMTEGVHFNYESWVDGAVESMRNADPSFSRQLFESVVDEGTARTLYDQMETAVKTGKPEEIDRVLRNAKQTMETHLDDMVANIGEIAASETEAFLTSKNGLERVIDTINGNELDMWSTHLRQQVDDIARINEVGDNALRNAMWMEAKERWDKGWTRYQNWYQGVIEGVERGSKNSGYEVQGALGYAKERIDNIRRFNEQKNNLWNDFFEKKGDLDFDQRDIEVANIRNQVNGMYDELINSEGTAMQKVDEAMSLGLPQHLRPAFMKARENGRALRQEYMRYMTEVYQSTDRSWTEIVKKRMDYMQKINNAERMSIGAASGDPRVLEVLNVKAEKMIAKKASLYTLANNYGIASMSDTGKPLDGKLLKIINKHSGQNFTDIKNVPGRIAKEAFIEHAKKHQLLPDVIVKPERIDGLGLNALWGEMGENMYDSLGNSAKKMMKEKVIRGTPEQQKALRPIIDTLKGKMADTRLQAVDMAKTWRDSALLDYSKRTNFDNFTGMMMPYSFWATHSIYNWALWSIERPFVFSTYLKMKKFNETHVGGQQMSTRFKDNIGIPMPFWEKWLGDAYVNPLAIALPFEKWEMPLEQYQRQLSSDEGWAVTRLKQMLDDNEITQQQYDDAVNTKGGELYNNVLSDIQSSGDRYNSFDFMNMMFAPHAPLVWAYQVARGTPERIQPLLPVTRNIKALTAYFGVGPAGGLNIEAPIRKALGLPEYDQWEDYRIERELNNLAANGEITPEEAMRAMIDKQGDIYTHAKQMAGKESAQAIVTGILGVPLRPYPTGEKAQREMYSAFQKFAKSIDNLPEQEKNKAIGKYIDQNPELKAKFALNKEPEERLRSYLVDSLWDRWNNLNDLNKKEAKEQLGDMFNRGFLQEQAYGAIDLDTLAMWNKQLGGTNPGKMDKPVIPLQQASPEISEGAQLFYNTRDQYFPNWYLLQEQYYSLKAGKAREKFVAGNTEYRSYVRWKQDYLQRNPKIAPYLTDNEPQYESVAHMARAQANEPQYTWQEWASVMPEEATRLFADYYADGNMTVALKSYLDSLALKMNMSYADILKQMEASYTQ